MWWGHENRFTLKKTKLWPIHGELYRQGWSNKALRCFDRRPKRRKISRSTPSSIRRTNWGIDLQLRMRKYLFGSDRNLLIIFSFRFALRRRRRFSEKRLPLPGGRKYEKYCKLISIYFRVPSPGMTLGSAAFGTALVATIQKLWKMSVIHNGILWYFLFDWLLKNRAAPMGLALPGKNERFHGILTGCK